MRVVLYIFVSFFLFAGGQCSRNVENLQNGGGEESDVTADSVNLKADSESISNVAAKDDSLDMKVSPAVEAKKSSKQQAEVEDADNDLSVVTNGSGEGDASFQWDAMQAYEKLMATFAEKGKVNGSPKEYPDYFGGASLTSKGRLKVFIHGNMQEGKKKVKAILIDDRIVDYVACNYSTQELNDLMNFLNEHVPQSPDSIRKNVRCWFTEDNKNRVVVGLRSATKEDIENFEKAIVKHPAIKFREWNYVLR